MTIHLPEELESSILVQVDRGHFASLDEAMAEAARLLLRELEQVNRPAMTAAGDARPDPILGSIGAMRDAADELDEIVADAMKSRQEPWRVIDGG